MNRVFRAVRLPLLALVCLLVAACGFHLRGETPLPAWLESAWVESDVRYSEVADELRRALRVAGVSVPEQPEQANAVIRIEGEQSKRRILSVGSDGRPREYELNYQLSYGVYDPAGKVLLPPQTVTETKAYTFNEVDVLGKSTERDELWRELRRGAVAAVMNRLRYSQPVKSPE